VKTIDIDIIPLDELESEPEECIDDMSIFAT
jgi:hypothetical protein